MKKRINNKGFTLIELLGVLVILTVIMSIAIPSITSSIERSKDKQRNQTIKIITTQGELYADSHKNSFNKVSVSELIESGYLTKEEAKDPMNEKSTICGYVVKSDDGSFTFVEDNTYCVGIS